MNPSSQRRQRLPESQPAASPASTLQAKAPAPLRVFVVENDPDTLELLRFLLECHGHLVDTAATLTAALERIPTFAPDALLSDIGLDDGTGWELMRLLQNTRPRYAVAMSGFGTSDDCANSRDAGFRHHLQKPVPPWRIEEVLAEAARERPAVAPT